MAQASKYDAHIHMALDGVNWRASLARHKACPDEALIRKVFAAYAREGITYIRDGGDKFGAAACAARIAPEYGIVYASPHAPLCQKGNYGSFLGLTFETFDDFCALVDTCVRNGATFIKIMTTGILDFDTYGLLTGYVLDISLLANMVAYVHSLGLAVMAHTNGARAVMDALACGVDSIEHGYYLDEEVLCALARSQTIWVPTFAPICNVYKAGRYSQTTLECIAKEQMQNVAEAARLGAIIACGSDAGASGVLHVQAAKDERIYLREALGSQCDDVLERGLQYLQERFSGMQGQ